MGMWIVVAAEVIADDPELVEWLKPGWPPSLAKSLSAGMLISRRACKTLAHGWTRRGTDGRWRYLLTRETRATQIKERILIEKRRRANEFRDLRLAFHVVCVCPCWVGNPSNASAWCD
jgi:hypothetical protein